MNVRPVHPAPKILPAAVPTVRLDVVVSPAAGKSFNHVSGEVTGTVATYQDINACTWYVRGGWEYRNGRKMSRRGLSGGEDVGAVKRQ
ncbi:hypothetical protein [Deinococcus cellulosilyticus]|uniref:Uncharacterized protein n=1 Tax=Deinococcus cellulosilyticus (strain DSM 18568 / NBRC 106333 / KACC 11606 / 5516J-15) TaxID=1223518 RepID=A0A511MXK6_DEIC1|nr:hypothetical protein [Deinococcus cellulosilyticus]GEM45299.1 hypothetical protein DC3_09340 [Deinococcus cellulosilyticus NBRC 106333 = KACC 11606]